MSHRQRLAQLANTPIPGWLVIVGSILPIVIAVSAAARFVKRSADNAYVSRDSFAIAQARETERHHAQDEIQKQLIIKIDSANLRLTQIQCGKRIETGCR